MRKPEKKAPALGLGAKMALGVGVVMGAPKALLAAGVDAALVGAAIATAVGTVTFAGFMIARSDDKPNINGMKYLAIFAQPSKTGKPSGEGAEPEAAPAPKAPAQEPVDMSPVGSIAAAPTSVAGYALVSAQPGVAWLREGARIVAVRPGDEAPGLGRIARIVQRDGRWFLIGDAGTALLSSAAPAAAQDAPAAPAPFNKRMIFGGD